MRTPRVALLAIAVLLCLPGAALAHAATRHNATRHAKNGHVRARRAKAHRAKTPSRSWAAHSTDAVETVSLSPASLGSTASSSAVVAPSGPCTGTDAVPTAADLPEVRAAIVCLINQVRARDGLAPLALNGDLERVAREHNEDMIREDYFAHVSPGGLSPLGRMQADGYLPQPDDEYSVGENIAWATTGGVTPRAIVADWLASPEHVRNILNSEYLDTGVSVYPAAPAYLSHGAPGALYAQEFGLVIAPG